MSSRGHGSLVQGLSSVQLPRLKLHPVHTHNSKDKPASLNLARFARGEKHDISKVMRDSLLALQQEKLLPQEATGNWRTDCLDVTVRDIGSGTGKLQFMHPAAASNTRGAVSPRAARPIHEIGVMTSHLDFYLRSPRPEGANGLNHMPIIMVGVTGKGFQVEFQQLTEIFLWAVVVDGGEAELYTVLNALGKMGAIRHDLSTLFSVHTQIGVGGFSSIFVGVRQLSAPRIADKAARLEQQVALKVTPASGEHVHKSVCQEVSMHLACQNHPNIVKIMGVFWNTDLGEQCWVLAQSLCSRGDLYDFVHDSSPVPEETVGKIMSGLFSAINHVHGLRIVHRDVKPENVLLSEDAQPMLCDFGIAGSVDDPVQASLTCGSPGYIAPEALQGRASYHTLADIFSAGCVFFYILTGMSPFSSPSGCAKELLRKNAACQVDWEGIDRTVYSSQALHALLEELLRKQPFDRPTAKLAGQHRFLSAVHATDAAVAPTAGASSAASQESRKNSSWVSGIPSRLKQFVSTPRKGTREESRKAERGRSYQVLGDESGDKESENSIAVSWPLGKDGLTAGASDKPQELKVKPWPAEAVLSEAGRVKPFSFRTKRRSGKDGGGRELTVEELLATSEGSTSVRKTIEALVLEPDLEVTEESLRSLRDEEGMLGETDAARGNVSWWRRDQAADREGRRSAQEERALQHSFGVCEFQTVDGPQGRRHLVKILNRRRDGDIDDENADDADDDSDTESWHSWRRPPSMMSGMSSRGPRRSSSVGSHGSMASIESRESGIAMREFLQRGFEARRMQREPSVDSTSPRGSRASSRAPDQEKELSAIGLVVEYQQQRAQAAALATQNEDEGSGTLAHLRPSPPSSGHPSQSFRRERRHDGRMSTGANADEERQHPLRARPVNDWGVCQFYQEPAGPGQRPRRMVQALGDPVDDEDDAPAHAFSWRSLDAGAAPPRSSESFQSNDSGLPLHSESAVRMREYLSAAQAVSSPSGPGGSSGGIRRMARNPDAGLYENSISVEAAAAAAGGVSTAK
eukprot:TRINITY_DN30741_c0_g1_i1.p1 TRINITY_DN30741_c0_g1~~TRINITY_DN30741_c0_g1_i1.p1  ORF type:complete len:1031 (-),score=178.83 TRINITY_DN30741_c0_g1_i1:62-3154(-)